MTSMALNPECGNCNEATYTFARISPPTLIRFVSSTFESPTL